MMLKTVVCALASVLMTAAPVLAQDNGSNTLTCSSVRTCRFPNIVDGFPPDCFCTVVRPPVQDCGPCEIRRGHFCLKIACSE